MTKITFFLLFQAMSFLTTVAAWADGATASAPAAPIAPPLPAGATSAPLGAAASQPGGLGMFIPLAAMFAVVYFLVLRPQQKKMKEQQDMISTLKHGDEIITASGLLGKITGITDKVVTVEVADNVRVKMLKSQVSQILKGPIKDLA